MVECCVEDQKISAQRFDKNENQIEYVVNDGRSLND